MSSTGHCLDTLLKDVPLESIPTSLGGTFSQFNEPFHFDLSEEGPFFLEGYHTGAVTQAVSRLSLNVGDTSVSSIDSIAVGSNCSIATSACKEKDDKLNETSETLSNTSGSCCSDNDH